jgi:UDP-3-O-[3-hydroxymyristoyl] glucosamine N-acyltransferase
MKMKCFLNLLPGNYASTFGVAEVRNPVHLQRARLTSFTWSRQHGTICLAADKSYYLQAADNPHVAVIICPRTAIARALSDKAVIVAARDTELFYTVHNAAVHRLVDDWPARVPRVAPTAQVAHSAIIGPAVSIGEHCTIGERCLVTGPVDIGDDCIIHPHVTIGTEGLFSKKVLDTKIHIQHFGGVRIGGHCIIHAGSNVARSVNFNEWTDISDDVRIGIHVNIGHDCKVSRDVDVSGKVMLAGRVTVGEGAWLGAAAVVSNAINIGKGATVRIGSVVIEDVPDGADVSGNFAVDHTRRLREHLVWRRRTLEAEETGFAFRGDRDYLHGTTVFDHILSIIGATGRDIDFSFSNRTHRNCVLTTEQPGRDARVIGTYRDADRRIFIVEGRSGMTKRLPYDEEGIGGACRIEGNQVHVAATLTGYTCIEKLVAAYKRLLLTIWSDRPRRFAFVRLQLTHVPAGSFTVKYARRLSGNFYQGAVIENGQRIGAIFFGEWA